MYFSSEIHMDPILLLSYMRKTPSTVLYIALAPNVVVIIGRTSPVDRRFDRQGEEADVWLVRSDERAWIAMLVWLCSLCDTNCCFTPRPVLDYTWNALVGHVRPRSNSFRNCAVTKSPTQLPVCESLS